MAELVWRPATAEDVGRLARFYDRFDEIKTPEYGIIVSVAEGKAECRFSEDVAIGYAFCDVQDVIEPDAYHGSIPGTKVATATVQVRAVEQWPKWYADSGLIYRRDDKDTLTLVQRNGHEYKQAGTVELFDEIASCCKELTEAEAKSRLTPQCEIPAGVYYSPNALNFYCADSRRGMGNDFYVRWYDRREEFPQEPLSTCPDCGEFRGHGHEDVCPMATQSVTATCEPEHLPARKPVRLFADSETRQMTAFFGDGKDRVYKSAIDDCEVKYDGKQFFVETPQ